MHIDKTTEKNAFLLRNTLFDIVCLYEVNQPYTVISDEKC